MVRERGLVVAAGVGCGVALLLACSSAAPQPAVSVLPAASAAPAAGGLCRFNVEKTTFEEVEVSVAGARFTLGVVDVPSRIQLLEGERDARIEVQAPLAFSATRPRGLLPLRVAVATEFHGGCLRVGAGLDPTWMGVRGEHLLLSLEHSLGLVLEAPLELPCSHVSLRGPMESAETPESESTNATQIGMGWDSFPLHAHPGDADAIIVRYGGPVGLVETQPGWWHIVATWSNGSRLDGWTPERESSPHYDAPGGSVAGLSFVGGMVGVVDGPILQKARLHAGASVAYAPAGAAWAHATHDVEIEVIVMNVYSRTPTRTDGWLPLATVPGLVPPPTVLRYLEHAWVHRSELTLIEDAVETSTSGG